MRKAKLFYSLFLALLIVGCQSSGQNQSMSAASPSAKVPYQAFNYTQGDAKFFRTEMNAASSSFAEQLVQHCTGSNQVSALESCFRTQIADAFDAPSIGRQACGDISEFKAYSECIGIGTMANKLRQKITTQHRPEMATNDWRTPKDYLKTLTKGLILDITDTCLAGDLANVEHCARAEFARAADISGHFAETCNAKTDTSEYGNCVGEAMAVQFLQSAADRLGAKSAALSRQPALQVAERTL